jgi:hypothetical protein
MNCTHNYHVFNQQGKQMSHTQFPGYVLLAWKQFAI